MGGFLKPGDQSDSIDIIFRYPRFAHFNGRVGLLQVGGEKLRSHFHEKPINIGPFYIGDRFISTEIAMINALKQSFIRFFDGFPAGATDGREFLNPAASLMMPVGGASRGDALLHSSYHLRRTGTIPRHLIPRTHFVRAAPFSKRGLSPRDAPPTINLSFFDRLWGHLPQTGSFAQLKSRQKKRPGLRGVLVFINDQVYSAAPMLTSSTSKISVEFGGIGPPPPSP